MKTPKSDVQTMSEGDKLTLNKINEIVQKANDRRIIGHVTSISSNSDRNKYQEYDSNDSNSVLRIEARTFKTEIPDQFGRVFVRFTSATAFASIPLVVCTWGDWAGLRFDQIGTGNINPPILSPWQISKEGFWVLGARENKNTRINYIAIGPAG